MSWTFLPIIYIMLFIYIIVRNEAIKYNPKLNKFQHISPVVKYPTQGPNNSTY